jgi:XapX domain-containing protein
MKVLFVSFLVGLFVGVLYGVIRVKSPAPPIVALVGLLGTVLGEQVGGWILQKRSASHTRLRFASCLNTGMTPQVGNRSRRHSLPRTEKASTSKSSLAGPFAI